jgi:aldehyde dehydrogenase (NAD+)
MAQVKSSELQGSKAPAAGSIPEQVERVREIFDSGRTKPIKWRLDQLVGISKLLHENEAELADALAEDFGKPRVEAWLYDMMPVIAEVDHARKHLAGWSRKTFVWPGMVNLPGVAWTSPEPLGTVLIISPWNYPVLLALAPLVAAISAGNTVVIKPSELTPATSAALGRLIPKYLDPEAVVVFEGGVDVATELLDLPFDHIFFTGSTTVGKVVMSAAAKHLSPVTLELGGKSPAIVLRDAPIETTARRIAWAKLANAGQTCVAPDYVLVDSSVADTFVAELVKEIGKLEGPNPSETRTQIVNDRHLQRLELLLKESGGEVVTGGGVDHDNRYIEPTVIVEPDQSSPLMQDEIFGPILPVIKVDSIDEATRFVRGKAKPLALYVFTRSPKSAQKVLESTSSGGACVNQLMSHLLAANLPFGGVGPSGIGAYHGKAGFDALSHRKSVLRRSWRIDPSFAYPPFDQAKEKLLRRIT